MKRFFKLFLILLTIAGSGCIHWPGIDNHEKNHLYKPSVQTFERSERSAPYSRTNVIYPFETHYTFIVNDYSHLIQTN